MPWWLWLLLVALAFLLAAAAAAFQLRRDRFACATLAALQCLTWRQRFEVARAIARDRRVPRVARWLPLALAAYLAFPIDVIPDFIPVIGQLDDILAVALVLWLLVRLVPHEVIKEHLAAVAPG
ncbi:MAG: YkvA family protein [Dehalococcoidia bacterium]